MDLFSRYHLQQLLADHDCPCVSVFLPTKSAGRETLQNRIRFENLLNQAEEKLQAAGLRSPVARDLLAEARDRERTSMFWTHQADGLAMFIAPKPVGTRFFRLPIAVEESVVVADRFHIQPLLPLIQFDGFFYILAVSQHQARLFQATQQNIAQVEVDPPQDVEQTLDLQRLESLQMHSQKKGRGQRSGTEDLIFHGHDDTNQKQLILEAFRRLNDALEEYFGAETAPLVFAGVEYLYPLFSEANTYRGLADEFIHGSAERMPAEELHRKAWPIVEPLFREKERQQKLLFQEGVAKKNASSDLGEILSAVEDGRVGTLFVARGAKQWGSFDPVARDTSFDTGPTGDNEDLVEACIRGALGTGGEVYVLETGEMPSEAPVGAIFRYVPTQSVETQEAGHRARGGP